MNHRNNLLVEGNDDKHVIMSLMKYYEVPHSFDITYCNGIENVLLSLNLFLNQEASRIEAVAIVVDADLDNHKRWQSVKNIISITGAYDLPNDIPSEGLILIPKLGNYPKLGVWIMPNNISSGILEDFVVMLAENNDELMLEAESVLNDLERKGINKYKLVHRAKAKIHSYLAWQDEPGKPMGQAITARVLNPEAPMAQLFVDWVNRVFNS